MRLGGGGGDAVDESTDMDKECAGWEAYEGWR